MHRVLGAGLCLRVMLTLLGLAAGFAHADYLWLQPEGGQLVVKAGELHKPLDTLPALQGARSVSPEGKPTALQPQAEAFVLAPNSQGDQRFVAMVPGEGGLLTYYQARFGRQQTEPVNDLELVPTQPHGDHYRLFFKGKPVAASQVSVATSEGWSRTLRPDADGSVGFKPWFPGLYVLTVSARVNHGSVTLGDKVYDDVRHTTTLSFEVQP
jgi:hypothetical protein